mmetsp:Transcript_9409/g.20634  ORF Transcript_9409/g.20634 Transcript_9409/m.20634 type:complete len:257 (-) Transcript_9409:1157-1927(-)
MSMAVARLSAMTVPMCVRLLNRRRRLGGAVRMAVSMARLTTVTVAVSSGLTKFLRLLLDPSTMPMPVTWLTTVTVAMVPALIIALRRGRLWLWCLHLPKCSAHATPQSLTFHVLVFLTLFGQLFQSLCIGVSGLVHEDIVAIPDCVEEITGLNQSASTTIQSLHVHTLHLQHGVTMLFGVVPQLELDVTQCQIEITNLLQLLGLVFAIFILPAIQIIELVCDCLVFANRHSNAASLEQLPPDILAALPQGKLIWLR